MTTTRVPVSYCVDCGNANDATTSIMEKARPSPGDATVCIHCGHIAVFADDLTLREPNRDEQIALAGDPRILAVQRARAKLELRKK
jgi:hypothetical protein